MMDEANQIIKGKKCPSCGADLKVVSGRYSPFIGCSGYPKCRYMEKIKKPDTAASGGQVEPPK